MKKINRWSLFFIIFLFLPTVASANCMWALNNECKDIGTTNTWVPAKENTYCNATPKPTGETAKCCCADGDIPGCCEKKDSTNNITTENTTGMNCQQITYATTKFYQDQEAYANKCQPKQAPLTGCNWRIYYAATRAGEQSSGGCGSDETQAADNKCTGSKQSVIAPAFNMCCCASTGLNELSAGAPKFTMPELQISIPGLKLTPSSSIKVVPNDDGTFYFTVPWLSEYLMAIYNYGLAIAGVLAAIILMAGGVLWLISSGDASTITQAKELITGSITGLVILMSSYIILVQINPDLTKFKPITIGTIKKIDLIFNGSDSESNAASGANCLSDSELIKITDTVTSHASDPRLSKNAYEGLKKAIAEAKKQGVELQVNSANRSYTKQKELWDAELKKFKGDEIKTRKYVASPANCTGTKCYGHCAGVAIDVCIKNSTSCGKMSSGNAKAADADIVKLQNIMKAAGWIRYCGEWWHFQYGLPPGQSCSP